MIKDITIGLDTTLFTDTDAFRSAGVYLEDWFKREGLITNKSTKRREHLQLILANLLVAHEKKIDGVSYSRNRNDYSPSYRRKFSSKKLRECSDRYSPFGASYEPLIGAVDNLQKLELIGGRLGYQAEWFENYRESQWSRMWVTEKLLQVIKEQFDIEMGTIGFSLDKEIIRLRDADKNEIDYEDTQETLQMRENLHAFNQLLQETELGLKDYEDEKEEAHHINLNKQNNKFMYRVFNDSSFDKGGRFNGGTGFLMGTTSRSNYAVKSPSTRMRLYYSTSRPWHRISCTTTLASRGKSKSDPTWWKSGMMPEDWSDLQKVHKKLLQFALNTDSVEEWEKVAKGHFTMKRFPKQGPIEDRTLYEFLHKFHTPIRDYLFNKTLGLTLFKTESRIAEEIIMTFVNRSIPLLPIHDGFICPQEHEEFLRQTMMTAYETITGMKPSGIHRE